MVGLMQTVFIVRIMIPEAVLFLCIVYCLSQDLLLLNLHQRNDIKVKPGHNSKSQLNNSLLFLCL